MFLEQSIISPTGSTAPGDPTTPAATNYPHTHTPNPNPSAASSPETTDDPETCALTPPPTTSTRFTALLSTNAASLTLARHSRTGLTTHLHTLTAQKDALLHKLQDTMTTPTPHYTATSYDDGLMATHSLLTACREAESDLAYNWLELYQLRSQRAALLAAREAEIQRLQKLIEEGEREVRMLNGIVGVLGCRWPGAPVEVRYEGIYGGRWRRGW
ncbi:uncharacterized protein LAJ45_03709 [Morchella importuna]|uniref:uncharacterized protein n=1 Tax=Morchella importuna TaxID=1174673 RepID=UPI001E8D4470|nr:uncharacterized protein LAJ45_03709 [Morchella importuna]KAH8152282.1 hypothetical protein LAJ45_03709 [Morchella importuna]